MSEAIEAHWRALGLEADRVVNDARQKFERDLKVEQPALIQAAERQHLRYEALIERDGLRVELESVRR